MKITPNHPTFHRNLSPKLTHHQLKKCECRTINTIRYVEREASKTSRRLPNSYTKKKKKRDSHEHNNYNQATERVQLQLNSIERKEIPQNKSVKNANKLIKLQTGILKKKTQIDRFLQSCVFKQQSNSK